MKRFMLMLGVFASPFLLIIAASAASAIMSGKDDMQIYGLIAGVIVSFAMIGTAIWNYVTKDER